MEGYNVAGVKKSDMEVFRWVRIAIESSELSGVTSSEGGCSFQVIANAGWERCDQIHDMF